MTELLKQYGFDFKGSCSCDGVYSEKYRKGDYEVRWRKRKGIFKIRRFGVSLTGWIIESEIENYLKKYDVQTVQKEA